MTRNEHITATGWRVVGAPDALARVADSAAAMSVAHDEDVLFSARFQLRPRLGTGSAVPLALAALGDAVRVHWTEVPPLLRDRPVTRAATRFHGLQWRTLEEEGTWTGELLWRHPHPVIAGVPCTTQVLLSSTADSMLMGVRVTADEGLASVRGSVGAGQARPALLDVMYSMLRMTFDGRDGTPQTLHDGDIDGFVRDVLLSDTRQRPVAVLSPFEHHGYAVPPATVAAELLGLAHVYVLDKQQTSYVLSDALGDRRLSCYWGALRVYLPTFSCADRPEDHPLLQRDQVMDPVMRAGLVGKLGRSAQIVMPAGIAQRQRPAALLIPVINERQLSAVGIPAADAPHPGETAAVSVSDPQHVLLADALAPIVEALGARIEALSATITALAESNLALSDEVARLRATGAVRAGTTTSLERQIGNLERMISDRVVQPNENQEASAESARRAEEESDDRADDEETVSLVETLRHAATAHPEALYVLDSAERAAANSPYGDNERLAAVLDAMAAIARRRQDGGLRVSLRDAFREFGIDYRGGISRSTSEKQRQQYVLRGSDGTAYDCHEHVVLGASHDPRHCLRVYFTSRAPLESRFVIGHVGRHFDVLTTN